MKNLLFILLVFVAMATASAQDKDLRIIATSGSSYQLNDIYLDWTLGETVTRFYDQPSTLLSQGFHQPAYSLTALLPLPKQAGQILILPNPFTDFLEIKMSFHEIVKGQASFYDLNGKLLWKKSFEAKDIAEKISTPLLPSGQYCFVVALSDNSLFYSYPVIKI